MLRSSSHDPLSKLLFEARQVKLRGAVSMTPSPGAARHPLPQGGEGSWSEWDLPLPLGGEGGGQRRVRGLDVTLLNTLWLGAGVIAMWISPNDTGTNSCLLATGAPHVTYVARLNSKALRPADRACPVASRRSSCSSSSSSGWSAHTAGATGSPGGRWRHCPARSGAGVAR